MKDSTSYDAKARYALAVLFLINTLNFFDRVIAGALGEPIRREWNLSDSALGALGTAFTLLYAVVGIPFGRLSDRKSRKSILAVSVVVWSVLTSLSGFTRTYWQLFVTRLGVGVGEAACAPAATSLIGDLYPPSRRARALSIFMMGLPAGNALSFLAGSFIAHSYGWRTAFFVAGIPGLVAALAVRFIDEPQRGMKETLAAHAPAAGGSWRDLLPIRTMWWLSLSGALLNFNMYALGSFLTPLLMRYFGADLRKAGLMTMLVYGLSGVPGLLAGGALADRWSTRRRDGRLLVGMFAILISAPLLLLALSQRPGNVALFVTFSTLGCMAMYVYYSSVYATVHDIVAPSLRGTAMSIYFFAMYVLGGSFGPLITGMTSDHFTRRAATAAGLATAGGKALEPFRGTGLHSAMYLIPASCIVLTLVLYAASRTVGGDMDRMDRMQKALAESR